MRYALLFAITFSTAQAAEDKSLAKLNALTQALTTNDVVAAEEVERLFEQAEVIAFRDATRGVTPQAINYAASCERAFDAYALKGQGPPRVLIELALTLAGFGGPQSAAQADRFHSVLIASMNIKPTDARPMPELPTQMAEIGQWAVRTVEKLAPRLPPDEATLARLRLFATRGEFAEAAALAQKHPELGPRGQAWRIAALILKGEQPKEPVFDGEAALIVRGAKVRRARMDAAKVIGENAWTRCHQMFASPAGSGGADMALACATLLWDEPDRAWLANAAKLVPAGAAGAPVRAANLLRVLFGNKRPNAAGRAELLASYRKELEQIGGDQRRALWLLGNVAAAEQPMMWGPTTPEEQKEMLELDRGSPCDEATFALRTLAVRGNPPALAKFAASIVERCVSAPGGVPVAADALGMLLALAHDAGPLVKSEGLDQLALSLARAHPTDPEAIGAHADVVAAHALAQGGADKAPLIALEAALARYEEALKHTTPASGSSVRARLDQNAGFLSLAVATRLEGKKREPFLVRAQRHLRFALALDDHPAGIATRAHFDMMTAMHMGPPPSLDKVPPSPAKARAACWIAAQLGPGSSSHRYVELAKSAEKSTLDAPELLIAPQASFNVSLDGKGLHPAAEMRATLWLAPACDPLHLPTVAKVKSAPHPSPKP